VSPNYRPATTGLVALIFAALACSTLPETEVSPEPAYRYDDLPAAGHEDMALAEYRAISYWEKFDLSYHFMNGTDDLPGDREQELVAAAFGLWAAQTPLAFTEVSDADQADILIGWAEGGESLGDPFDGPGGVLAQASYPNPYQDRSVILQFDDGEHWVDSESRNVDLLTVATHEIGHNLGLDHSRDPDAIMFASYSGPHRSLSPDDVAGIQSIYGIAREPAGSPEVPPAGATPPPSENQDTDQDGISDADEVLRTGTNPDDPDSDHDGLEDGVETVYRMNPLDPDMDKDGVSDGQEVALGSDPFFPDQDTDVPAELEDEISQFLTSAIELEIRAYEQGDAAVADSVMAGDILAALEANIDSLNSQGLIQLSAIDYYESFINEIRVISEVEVEVDTCEVWSSAIYRSSDGALVQSDGPTLLPQTITLQNLADGWFITGVQFFDAPAFCQ